MVLIMVDSGCYCKVLCGVYEVPNNIGVLTPHSL